MNVRKKYSYLLINSQNFNFAKLKTNEFNCDHAGKLSNIKKSNEYIKNEYSKLGEKNYMNKKEKF